MVDAAWVALSLTHRLGGKTLKTLQEHFHNDLSAILAADEQSLQAVPGIGPKIAQAIRQIDLSVTIQAIERWQKAGVHILTSDDADYPAILHHTDDAPPTLFARGALSSLNRLVAYAIVGTRQPTKYAYRTAQHLAAEIVDEGYVLVSGLAEGIDTAAHLGALSVQTGSTVAVLGSGVLDIYPPTNGALAQAIMARGALLSEVAPDSVVSVPGLVARNRIITGLCEGVIVVETGIDGGAMHAARFAEAQRKKIYVLENSASGNKALIDGGAVPIPPSMVGFGTLITN